MKSAHQITNLEQLREVIAAPKQSTAIKVMSELDASALEFIAASPLVLVATTSSSFEVDVSPKGDQAGFAQAPDAKTLLLPERSGNGLAFGFQNILQTGAVGLIFLVPGVRETLRVNGRAILSKDPELLARFAVDGKPALMVTQLSVQECFFHCGKAFVRSQLWNASSWQQHGAQRSALKNWSRVFAVSESRVDDLLEHDYRCNL